MRLEEIKKGTDYYKDYIQEQPAVSLPRTDAVQLRRMGKILLNADAEFKPGDIVEWKKGLKNKRYPAYEGVAVVIEKLEQPIYDDSDGPGSPYFREPLDLILGLNDEEGNFVLFHFDSRRFRHVEEFAASL